jgi:hypothetical protein
MVPPPSAQRDVHAAAAAVAVAAKKGVNGSDGCSQRAQHPHTLKVSGSAIGVLRFLISTGGIRKSIGRRAAQGIGVRDSGPHRTPLLVLPFAHAPFLVLPFQEEP